MNGNRPGFVRIDAGRLATSRETVGLPFTLVQRMPIRFQPTGAMATVDPSQPASGERQARVAYQGEPGAWSEVAIRRLFGDEATATGLATFEDVFDALAEGGATAAVLPVENSTTGSIIHVVDPLFEADVHVTGETVVSIDHVLMAPPGASLAEVERVVSHPQALDQCRGFLHEHDLEPVPAFDTAGAAASLDEEPRGTAALAAERAARLHGLEVIAWDVPDQVNRTRFLRLEPEPRPSASADKTTVGFVTEHEPGALANCLQAFAAHGVNLLKVESRPLPDEPWRYRFLVDAGAGGSETRMKQALGRLHQQAEAVTVIGSYPRAETVVEARC